MNQEAICRWGILSAAGIARKNWQAIKHAPNAELVAVASRNPNSAAAFVDECQYQVPHDQVPDALGSYEELIEREDIDAVYLPLPTGVRKEWVLRAAEAGKHVLVEKPCGVSADDVQEMLQACEANNVQFMDGVMFMHSERLSALRETIDDPESIGEIRRITSHHSFNAPEDFLANNIRLNSALEPQGCLGDLGWYNIRFTLWALYRRMPSRVNGWILTDAHREDSPSPVPMEFAGDLHFDDGVSAHFYCSFITHNQQWANVGGTAGFVVVPDYVLPFYGNHIDYRVTNAEFVVDGCQFNMEERARVVSVPEYANNAPGSQESNLFQNFSAIAASGQLQPDWGQIALETQQVMDAVLLSAQHEGQAVDLA